MALHFPPLFLQGSDTQVRTQKTRWVFWIHPPKKPTSKKTTLLLELNFSLYFICH